MNINFSKISSVMKQKEVIEPRNIFMSLANKSNKYNGYLRDVQTEVLGKWFNQRDKKDNVIKMNTGSGKTVVGLLILKSCMNENKGKSVYVVPDNYLIKQVELEAKDLGINVTMNINDTEFLAGKSILLINIHKLINGKSIFGIGQNISVDNILIDDVHSCLEIAERKCMILIERSKLECLYKEICNLFEDDLRLQNENNLIEVLAGDYASNPMLVPFWSVKNKKTELLNMLHKHKDEEILKFNLPLIADNIELCDCVIAHNTIEISIRNLPIHKISGFQNAKRRIFMSATLGDDSVLVKDFDINLEKLEIICPQNAADIGDRMIIMPQVVNPDIADEDIKYELKKLSQDYRVMVIVPSNIRAQYWSDVSDRIFTSENINEICNYNNGLDILVNRYDGIDLKDDKCRLLVIDGLPNASTLYDKIEEKILADSSEIYRERVQKIEQGMGRGVRSAEDFCSVFIMGNHLVNLLYDEKIKGFFSVATLKQIDVSNELVNQIKGCSMAEIMDTIKNCLERNEEWVQLSKNVLSELEYNSELSVSSRSVAYRKAFNSAISSDYELSKKVLEECINKEKDQALIGYDKYTLAKYVNIQDEILAQEILLSAKKMNRNIISPIQGITYSKRINTEKQANQFVKFCEDKKYDISQYKLAMNAILEKLNFGTDHDEFEEAIKLLGEHIGFLAERPEKENNNGGPDNLWCVSKTEYYVIECKNEAISDEICKKDCGQLHNSKAWFYKMYGDNSKCVPIIIHRSEKFAKDASPDEDFKVLDEKHLELLKENIRKFSNTICTERNFKDINSINNNLQYYKLSKGEFISTFTI